MDFQRRKETSHVERQGVWDSSKRSLRGGVPATQSTTPFVEQLESWIDIGNNIEAKKNIFANKIRK